MSNKKLNDTVLSMPGMDETGIEMTWYQLAYILKTIFEQL